MWTADSSSLLLYTAKAESGDIIIGQELWQELERLREDIQSERYIYDTHKANVRMSFMEGCVRLTKSPFYGQQMVLMLWQKAFIEAMYSFKMKDGTDRFRRALLLVGRKNTKALDLDTRIPTPQGDKVIKDIKAGDQVFNEYGQPVRVKETSEVFKDRICYEVTFEDGEKIIADENHKWTVQTKGSRRTKKYIPTSDRKRSVFDRIDETGRIVVTTKDMVNDYVRERVDGKGKEYKYRVPMAEPIEYSEKELFSPYILGLWLGDGDKNDNRIFCALDDIDELTSQIKAEGIDVYSVKMFGGKYEVRVGKTIEYHRHDVREALRNIGVWKNKHIPEEYLTASIKQRWALLQGLMDTDGTCSKAGQCSFVQKSKKMIYGVSKLLSSLGIKHKVAACKAYCNGKDCGDVYQITFWVDKKHSCFRYARKKARLKERLAPRMGYKSIIGIKKIENRDTKCITVDNPTGLFLCGEKNTVTHNSEMCSALGLTELITGQDGSDIVCSSNDDNQASILYDAINTMRLMIDPKQNDTWKNQQHIKCFFNGSKIFKLSDRTSNKEGRNIDFAIIDEVHEMKTNDIVKAIEQSQSLKPNPKLILISTEGFVNDGFLDEELRKARKILTGEDDSISAERYLPWLYTQDDEQEVWTDERSWFKSNPSLGVIKRWDYMREQVDAARKSKADRMYTLAKDFNIKVSNSEAWLDVEYLANLGSYSLDAFRGTMALGGVDLAETTDMCSAKILLMKENDKTKYIHSMYWIPQGKLEKSDDKEAGAKYEEWAKDGLIRIVEGNEVDVTVVADWFAELYQEHKIRLYMCGYDQRFAKEFVKRMDEYNFGTEMVIQNRYVLSNPMRVVEADLRDGIINANDNPIDKWCLENTAVRVWDTGHIAPVKIKGKQAHRIDGTISLVNCYEMLRRYKTEFSNAIQE